MMLASCAGVDAAYAADRPHAAPQVFRVVPLRAQPLIVPQPSFEEMAEPEPAIAAPAPSVARPPAVAGGPLVLTPRNLGPGAAVTTSPVPRALPAALVSPQRLPPPPPRAMSETPPAPSGGRVVQLGAFRSPAEAEKALGAWRRDVPALFARVAEPAVTTADLGEKGVFYRVRVTGFPDSRKASEFCGEYKGGGRDCYVVP